MPSLAEWWIFLGAAALIAAAPGPGNLYVLARSLHGGRAEGVRSSVGNCLGALIHVLAASAGLSALLATSAFAFTLVKFVGAAYLVYLGVRTLWELRRTSRTAQHHDHPKGHRSAVVQGLITEVLNPKTAMFFLAFIPQFVHPGQGSQTVAFLALGVVFVALAVADDLLVAVFAGSLGTWIAANPRWQRRQRHHADRAGWGNRSVTTLTQQTTADAFSCSSLPSRSRIPSVQSSELVGVA